MKNFLVLLVCLHIGGLSYGQTYGSQTNGIDHEDHIKIILAKDSLRISFKDKSFKLNSTNDLDSCMRLHVGVLTLPVVDIETYGDITPQERRAVIVITDKYRCPVVSETGHSDGKLKGAVSKMAARYDHEN